MCRDYSFTRDPHKHVTSICIVIFILYKVKGPSLSVIWVKLQQGQYCCGINDYAWLIIETNSLQQFGSYDRCGFWHIHGDKKMRKRKYWFDIERHA